MFKSVKVLGYGAIEVSADEPGVLVEIDNAAVGSHGGFHLSLYARESKALRKALKAAERALRNSG